MSDTSPHTNAIDERALAEALRRVQDDFLEMPGLQVTFPQATRLWALDAALCDAALTRLVETRFLVRTRHAGFARAADDSYAGV